MNTLPTTALADRWLAFIRQHGAPCFVDWPDSIVHQWLDWHVANESLLVVHQQGEILGLFTGWQCFEAELERHWTADNPRGDCFYFSHCIATSPAAFSELIRAFNERWPHWRRLKLFWRRAGHGLVPVKPEIIIRLYSLVQRKVLKDIAHEPKLRS